VRMRMRRKMLPRTPLPTPRHDTPNERQLALSH
jgi:hypothetical protein